MFAFNCNICQVMSEKEEMLAPERSVSRSISAQSVDSLTSFSVSRNNRPRRRDPSSSEKGGYAGRDDTAEKMSKFDGRDLSSARFLGLMRILILVQVARVGVPSSQHIIISDIDMNIEKNRFTAEYRVGRLQCNSNRISFIHFESFNPFFVLEKKLALRGAVL